MLADIRCRNFRATSLQSTSPMPVGNWQARCLHSPRSRAIGAIDRFFALHSAVQPSCYKLRTSPKLESLLTMAAYRRCAHKT